MKSIRASFARSATISAAVNVGAMLIGLVTSIIAARLLGPKGRGELAAIQNWPMMFATLGTLGITVAAAYYSGKETKRARIINSTGTLLLLCIAIPTMLLGYLIMPYLLRAQTANLIYQARIYLLIVPLIFLSSVPLWVLQGMGDFDLWNALRSSGPISWLVIWIVVWITDQHAPSFVANASVCAYFLIMLLCQSAMWKKYGGIAKPDYDLVPKLFRYGLPSILASVPQALNLRLDQLLMAAFLPSESLGLYVVAVAWSMTSAPLMTALGQVAFPRLVGQEDCEAQKSDLARISRTSILVSFLLTIVLLFLTPFIIPFVFGGKFGGSVRSAFILVVAAGVVNVVIVLEECLRGLGKPFWPMYAEMAGLVFTVLLLILLIPHYRLVGAAIASLASYSVSLVIDIFGIKRETSLRLRQFLVPEKEDAIHFLKQISILLRFGQKAKK